MANPQQALTSPTAPAQGGLRSLNNISPVQTSLRPNTLNTHHFPDAVNQPQAFGLEKPAVVLRGGPNLPQRPHSYIATQLAQQNMEIQRQQLAQTRPTSALDAPTSQTKPRLPLPPNLRMESDEPSDSRQMVVLPGHPWPMQIHKDANRCSHKHIFFCLKVNLSW